MDQSKQKDIINDIVQSDSPLENPNQTQRPYKIQKLQIQSPNQMNFFTPYQQQQYTGEGTSSNHQNQDQFSSSPTQEQFNQNQENVNEDLVQNLFSTMKTVMSKKVFINVKIVFLEKFWQINIYHLRFYIVLWLGFGATPQGSRS